MNIIVPVFFMAFVLIFATIWLSFSKSMGTRLNITSAGADWTNYHLAPLGEGCQFACPEMLNNSRMVCPNSSPLGRSYDDTGHGINDAWPCSDILRQFLDQSGNCPGGIEPNAPLGDFTPYRRQSDGKCFYSVDQWVNGPAWDHHNFFAAGGCGNIDDRKRLRRICLCIDQRDGSRYSCPG